MTKQEFVDLAKESICLDGKNDYKNVDQLARKNGLRLSNRQVWEIIKEISDDDLQEVDW